MSTISFLQALNDPLIQFFVVAIVVLIILKAIEYSVKRNKAARHARMHACQTRFYAIKESISDCYRIADLKNFESIIDSFRSDFIDVETHKVYTQALTQYLVVREKEINELFDRKGFFSTV